MTTILQELDLRAYQERASARIGRTTKLEIAAHEHAATAFDNLANDIKHGRIEFVAPGEASDKDLENVVDKLNNPGMPWCDRCQCWHHTTAEHIKSPVRPIDRAYEGQAHYMSKAAHSLVNMLNGLDYSKFETDDAANLTTKIHDLVRLLEGEPSAPQTVQEMRAAGYAVVVFEPEELAGAGRNLVENRLVELGVEVISDLKPEDVADNLRRAQIGGAHDPRNDRKV